MRNEICICCGGEIDPEKGRVRGLTFYAFRRTIARNGAQATLTPLEFGIFESLLGSYPNATSHGEIIDDAWGNIRDDEYEGHRVMLRVYAMRIRERLAPLGLSMVSVSRYGYRLAVLETESAAA